MMVEAVFLNEMPTKKELWDDEWYEEYFHAAVVVVELPLRLRMGIKMVDGVVQ